MYDFIIIGGGITGVTMARLLQQKGIENVLVLEAKDEAGGLCRSKNIDGHILDLGGGHLLNSRFPKVYDFIFSHIPRSEFNEFKRVSKIKLGESIIDYPIESNLWQLPEDECAQYLISAIQSGEVLGKKEPTNYDEWITWKLGEKIAADYMRPYNKKIWGVDPSEMDIDWLHKIPRLDLKEIVLSVLRHSSDRSKFPSHDTFMYPKTGGFQRIFDAIHEPVKEKVLLSSPVTSIKHEKGMWTINNKYKAPVVINTAPWHTIFEALGKPSEIAKEVSLLKPNSIVVSLWEGDFSHDYTWLYLPEENLPEHRHFFINAYAPTSKKNGFFSETNAKRWPGKKGWGKDRTPIYEHVNDAAYPVPVLGHAKAIEKIREFYEPKKIFGVGRWGQWQYFNSDVCIHEAMKLVERITT